MMHHQRLPSLSPVQNPAGPIDPTWDAAERVLCIFQINKNPGVLYC